MGAIVTSDASDWTTAWPWPQVKFLKFYNLGIAPIGTTLWLYELKVVADSWVATPVMSIGETTDDLVINIADFGQFFTLSVYDTITKSLSCWIRNPGVDPDVEGAYSALPTINAPKFIAGCNYNGQCLIGGVETDDASWADLETFSVAWSAIGSFNFRAQDKTTAGFTHVPFGQSGETVIWKMLQMDNAVVAYANTGSAILLSANTPAVTWSANEKIGVPAISPDCIDGDRRKHCMIDKNYNLWVLDKEGGKRLGFKHLLGPLFALGQVLVRHEGKNDRFYISNGLTSYVLTSENKLYECHQCMTSVGYIRGQLCGIFHDTQDYEARFESNVLDFKTRAIKKIAWLEMGYQGSQAPQAMVRWRDSNGTMQDHVWKRFNDVGIASPMLSGVDFTIRVKVPDYRVDEFSVEYLNIRLQLSDKRFIRGVYALDKTDR